MAPVATDVNTKVAGKEAYTVERVSVADMAPEEFYQRFLFPGIPVIVTDMMTEWASYPKWTLAWFREKYGDLDVEVAVQDETGHSKVHMPLRDYIDEMPSYEERYLAKGFPAPYLRTWNFEDDLPELVEEIDQSPPFFKDLFKRMPPHGQPPFQWLFLGAKGATTQLHVDIWNTDAWLAQFDGSKKFTMFHPAHRKHLENEETNRFCEWSKRDDPAVRAEFPDLDKALPIEFILRPGETIYLPRRWPHHVVSLQPTLSLTINFLPKCNRKHVIVQLMKYMRRRGDCEAILGRPIRASDNLMKFCCHGGRLDIEMAKKIMGAVLGAKLGTVVADSSDDDTDDEAEAEGAKAQEAKAEEGEAGEAAPKAAGGGTGEAAAKAAGGGAGEAAAE